MTTTDYSPDERLRETIDDLAEWTTRLSRLQQLLDAYDEAAEDRADLLHQRIAAAAVLLYRVRHLSNFWQAGVFVDDIDAWFDEIGPDPYVDVAIAGLEGSP